MAGRERTIRPLDAAAVVLVAAGAVLLFGVSAVRGRDHAKRVLCSVNLMKYHAAMAHYLADNEETYCEPWICVVDSLTIGLPISCQWHDARANPAKNSEAAGQLWPYMGTDAYLLCETFGAYGRVHGVNHPGHHAAIPVEPQYSYSQNLFLGGMRNSWQPYGVVRQCEVKGPANVLVFTEENCWVTPELSVHPLNDTVFFARHPGDPSGTGDSIATYHGTTPARKDNGRGNAVFADGHVQLCDPWVRHAIGGGMYVTESFTLAWPKEKVFTQIPY